jgi:hypothetical protein
VHAPKNPLHSIPDRILSTTARSRNGRGRHEVRMLPSESNCHIYTLGGCTYLSQPVPIKDAMAIVERDLNDASPVALADVGTGREDVIKVAIRTAQCVQRTANPFVPVITGPVSLALQGSIQNQGALAGSATPSLTFTITQGKQQQVTVPITFVSALGLPNFYMGQQLANLTNLDSGANDKSQTGKQVSGYKTTAVNSIWINTNNLQALTQKTVDSYDVSGLQCTSDKYGIPFVPPLIPNLR